MKQINYDILLDIDKINSVYCTIRKNTKHKEKLVNFEIFKNTNFMNIYLLLKSKNYVHSKYNIFLISEPKHRIIMSENMIDKIINHLVSQYILFPILEPKLIEMNVATRKDKGTKQALFYLKKYINSLKINNENIYVLKCDIEKFFYSINHEILINKLELLIEDKDIMKILKEIITSTDCRYVNDRIDKILTKEKNNIDNLLLSKLEKGIKLKELENMPRYSKGCGLPIGNMTSQILAVFYLNEMDHFIKEKLKIKYYIRYMDDFILFSNDKDYLNYCLREIKEKLRTLKLNLNNKTQIYKVNSGFTFLGYKVILKNKKLYILMNKKSKKRIVKKIKYNRKRNLCSFEVLKKYNGYLINLNSRGFIYRNNVNDIIKKH